MSDMLHIDGSQGEGGGQIVALVACLGGRHGLRVLDHQPAGRATEAGLARQHLTALRAAAEICNAQIEGDEVGSRAIVFRPGTVKPGNYRFSVGTAGSTTLVLQTVLPALLCADAPSTLRLEGGTHNPGAPPFDFLANAYLPLIGRMGPQVSAALEQYGFYPAGGGCFTVAVNPSEKLLGFDLLERGDVVSHSARAVVSNLPSHIAQRELKKIAAKTGWNDACLHVEEIRGHGPGNVVLIELVCRHVTEVFTSFGELGVPAERVAGEALKQYRAYTEGDAPVGPHLADQLLLPLGISAWQGALGERRAGGSFRTRSITRHSTTHMEILRAFLGIDIEIQAQDGDHTVHVRPTQAT